PRARRAKHLRPRRRAERAADRARDQGRPRGRRNRARTARRPPVGHPMTTAASAVITQQVGQDGKPSVTYRYAGDRGVLIEYGDMVFDLALNFFVLAAGDALPADHPQGLIQTAPGLPASPLRHDPPGVSAG